MGDWFYEDYKRRKAAEQKRTADLKKGKIVLILGIILVAAALIMIPYHADSSSSISGEELQAGDACYIEDLRILDAKIEEDGEDIYCIASFLDKNQKEWVLSYHPGKDEHLVNRISMAKSLGAELDIVTSGYVYLYELAGNAKIYYSSRSKNYAEATGAAIINLDADYLCDINGNYTLEVLFRPGLMKASFVMGAVGIVYGILLLGRYRTKRED